MKFKLVEHFDRGLETQSSVDILNEDAGSSIRRSIKSRMITALKLNPNEGYVLHHIHNEKYVNDDDSLVNDYRDIKNVVLIPMSRANQGQGNDLHLLIHYLAQHKDEMDDKFCIGIKDGDVVYYSLNELVDMLRR